MDNVWLTAWVWMGLALLASLLSLRLGVSVALMEILIGMAAGNIWHLQPNVWINFLASFGSLLLTFLAGSEIDPHAFRKHWRASVVIGVASFLLPFLGALAYAYFVAGWSLASAKLAGIALSTTSVAVVYAVMVETGLNRTDIGKAILAACFVTDLGTVLALGILFAGFSPWMLGFIAVTVVVLPLLPRVCGWGFRRLGGKTQEVEMKGVFLILFGLGALATAAGSEAVLPAYLAGLVLAGTLLRYPEVARRLRSLAFALLTPFYFLKAGLYVSLPDVWHNAWLILIFFGVKMVTKIMGVRPLASMLGYAAREANYTTLLMATGLTFGTISSLYGLSHHIITQAQYTVLVTVVILSALVPTMVAQTWFQPRSRVDAAIEPRG
ncbi:potassium transporter Kef [Alicyclobacillus cellulosilyticus]|uniref:Potassium transporter Kef n=1 Tax=Alicyclobacillus cellulosilyticus TaxID=1003997 RepID=A0A917K7Y0_9BACL|nr:cation:proton antiporter [Alicyclobacillus cellulosilyticus]GGJ03962.1 potassium transporter Kef [Alicyclobacillus cellulosilyticus]